jgi:hypothetical protein
MWLDTGMKLWAVQSKKLNCTHGGRTAAPHGPESGFLLSVAGQAVHTFYIYIYKVLANMLRHRVPHMSRDRVTISESSGSYPSRVHPGPSSLSLTALPPPPAGARRTGVAAVRPAGAPSPCRPPGPGRIARPHALAYATRWGMSHATSTSLYPALPASRVPARFPHAGARRIRVAVRVIRLGVFDS